MAVAAKLPGGVSVVGRHDDDAVIIKSLSFQPADKTAHALVHLMQFERDAVIEARLSRPVRRFPLWQIVSRKLVHVLWLRIKKNRARRVSAMIKSALGLLHRGAKLQLV